MQAFFSRPLPFLIIVCILFLSLRLFNLSQAINFGSDAARDFLVTWNMYQTHHPVLIGPPSEYVFNGRQFFFGPAPYYFILPALLVGHWDPLAVSYFLIFLNLGSLLIALSILNSCTKNKSIIYYFAFFCICTPILITYSQSYWNPYFLLPVATLLVALLVKSRNLKRPFLLFFFIGFLFGLGLQFHYSFIFAIILSCIWLFFRKKLQMQLIGVVIAGFVVGFFPVILFELRNHFYNLSTILLIFTHPSSSETNLLFHSFYLISLLPFLFYILSLLLIKVTKVSHVFVYLFFVSYILWSVFVIFLPPSYPLSYLDAKQLATKIEKDDPKNFNIVDQLTRDNRAMPIRYLVTVQGYMPLGVTEYANTKTLYIYSNRPLAKLVNNPVYEIKSFLPYTSVTTSELADHIFFYKLQKK